MDTIYTGLADVGKILSFLNALVSTLVVLVAIGYGIYIIWVNATFLQDTQAVVAANSQCANNLCKTNVTWKDQTGKQYTQVFMTMNNYKAGDVVTVFFNQDDPQGSALLDYFPTRFGYFLIILAIVILIFTWGWYYLIDRFKWLAALFGGGEIIGVVAKLV